jgi:hypothetical protein
MAMVLMDEKVFYGCITRLLLALDADLHARS